ncbi:phage holin family protein [Nocardioides daphniae]|uniref:Membrane protein n=1 Tax=Nocardioides daphniae TaxID=402297 RepID=A0A4P7UBR1_9ACTN|nr:phage holin family protein [Nocardioides daphniae]QCC77603.1 phage holin family protein [Nocardioides daphniae]GGD30294.1 membrane protein [Nocardioides daphniae]
MSHQDPTVTQATGSHAAPGSDPSTGQLVSQLSNEVSRLVRDELKLAQVEVTGKAKQAGIGLGMFGAAGIIALYGVGVLLAAIVLALALVMDAWLAALIVAVVLFAIAAVNALMGKKRVEEAAPPVPTRAVAGVKEDVDAVRNPGAHHH